jgi:hypothetical protein
MQLSTGKPFPDAAAEDSAPDALREADAQGRTWCLALQRRPIDGPLPGHDELRVSRALTESHELEHERRA